MKRDSSQIKLKLKILANMKNASSSCEVETEYFSSAITRKLVRVDEQMDTARYRTILEGNNKNV